VRRAEAFFQRGNLPLGKSDDAGEMPSAELLEDRVQQALALLREVRGAVATWAGCDDVDRKPVCPAAGHTACAPAGRRRSASRCSSIFAGGAFKPMLDACRAIHQRVLKGRVWVALHMHAGDGNVHTNIPVNSDDYEMLQTAHEAVARIMALARSWTA
jgi:FAD/FMN-containing dehydrogenase